MKVTYREPEASRGRTIAFGIAGKPEERQSVFVGPGASVEFSIRRGLNNEPIMSPVGVTP